VAQIISLVFSVKNRDQLRFRNCLKTLYHQEGFSQEFEVILVDYGSEPSFAKDYKQLCEEYGVRLISIESTPHFSRSHALNIGIKHSNPESLFILPSDIDILFAPNFLSVVMEELSSEPQKLISCGHISLKSDAVTDDTDVVKDFKRLCDPKYHDGFRPWPGPCQAAARDWYFKIQGFDERFARYGSEDGDIMHRASRSGLKIVWVHDRTTLLHQWHTTQWQSSVEKNEFDEHLERLNLNQAYFLSDKSIIRNTPDGWGRIP
jgi:glycosyltransferase involved in cell wall biosynthesis